MHFPITPLPLPPSLLPPSLLPSAPLSPVEFRDLKTLDEFAAVVDLERWIWGPDYDDVVPVPILAVTVKRGGILVGAFADDRLIGFVYSIPAVRDGKSTQWSHMLGVAEQYRNRGLGHRLKLLQRERALALGVDLIEWTFDPMQATNAHLNFTKLGVVAQEYELNVYGESASPLHRGNPTDRFVGEWWIREAHVVRRIAARNSPARNANRLTEVRPINRARASGEWLESSDLDLTLAEPRVTAEIPMGFTDMLSRAPDRAMEWRLATREIFTTYFARGYRAVDFFLDRGARKGAYLLTRLKR